ncbi:MAG TPA: porin [Noviherbaspirillum sp.]|uniref:porin n=1 Tax=Noviherbaspirillum sp. TaxID=1926288 RepID=UPI002B495052|nr:porin [Noviherbaspirillum sp.]HJV88194.1 porin [Noviherbaspirillum sp.]
MKKLSLSALAFLTPLVSMFGMSSMAAAQSNITMYGIIDASISREVTGAGGATRMESGIHNGNRLGFRGEEDLGGGLSAVFTMENGFNQDDGTAAQGGRLFGRQAFVGLSSRSLGAVRLGRQYSPVYLAQLTVDPFPGMKGDMTGIRQWFNSGNFRVDNAIAYIAPSNSKFTGSALYSLGEVAGNAAASRQYGFSVGYTGSPLTGTLSHHLTKDNTGADSAKVWFVGGAYDIGIVKFHAAYDKTTGAGRTDIRDAMIGLTVPLRSSKIMASLIRKENKALSNADAHQVALGYLYDLSKRTALYTSAAYVNNEANSGVNAGGVNGAKNKVFDVGVRHTF